MSHWKPGIFGDRWSKGDPLEKGKQKEIKDKKRGDTLDLDELTQVAGGDRAKMEFNFLVDGWGR